jgi:hypothetical protein
LSKKDPNNNPLSSGKISRRFAKSSRSVKGDLARDRFAFDQAMQGHDCTKIRKEGDFVVQKRDFFGNAIGEPTVFEVKTGNSPLSEAQKKRKRQFGSSRYKVVRY